MIYILLSEGAPEVRALKIRTLEERALQGAVEEQALELGSNSYPHMPPVVPGAHGKVAADKSEPCTALCLRWQRMAACMREQRLVS